MKALEANEKRNFSYYFYLWINLYKNTLQRALEYRTNFLGRGFVEVLWVSSQVLFVYSIAGNNTSIAGWETTELLLFFGFMTLVDALFMLFIHDNLREFEGLLREGTFDFHLLRPVNSIFLSTMRFPNSVSIINLIYASGIILYACSKLTSSLSAANMSIGLLYLAIGFGLVFALNVFIMSLGFWMTRTNVLVWLFFEFYRLSFRPDDFYFSWLRRILFTIFPAAFFISVPVKIFLGKDLHPWLWIGPWLLLLVGIWVARTAWHKGIKNYEGALS